MTPFALLLLPFVPLTDALKCLDPFELFTLSQCSKKMVETIKLADTRKFLLSADFGQKEIAINKDFWFFIKEKSSDSYKKASILGYRNFGSNDNKLEVPVAWNPYSNYNLDTFWDSSAVGIETICFHLFEVFGCKIDTFSFHSSDEFPIEKFRSMIEEIMRKQNEIRDLSIVSDDFTDNDLKRALDNVNVTESLCIMVKNSHENFRYNLETYPKQLLIYDAPSLTLDNLISFKSCVFLQLCETEFTNKDLEVFVKLWKTGSYPNLEYIGLHSERMNDKEPVAGLTELTIAQMPTHKEREIMNETYKISEGYDIQRDDGVMGAFQLIPALGLNINFILFVWI